MLSLPEILTTVIFYTPMAATYIHPVLGLTVSTAFILWHYRHQPFKNALDQLERNYRPPTPFSPMEIIRD